MRTLLVPLSRQRQQRDEVHRTAHDAPREVAADEERASAPLAGLHISSSAPPPPLPPPEAPPPEGAGGLTALAEGSDVVLRTSTMRRPQSVVCTAPDSPRAPKEQSSHVGNLRDSWVGRRSSLP